jgi:peptidoglycan hydrolase-like protein with peptidoglycan-binding domain
MTRNSIVSLLVATLTLAIQPLRAQTVEPEQVRTDAGYSSENDSALVRAVQIALQKKGYNVGNTEGRYTSDTRAAVNRFERDHGLPETGTITRQVVQALGLS